MTQRALHSLVSLLPLCPHRPPSLYPALCSSPAGLLTAPPKCQACSCSRSARSTLLSDRRQAHSLFSLWELIPFSKPFSGQPVLSLLYPPHELLFSLPCLVFLYSLYHHLKYLCYLFFFLSSPRPHFFLSFFCSHH